MKPRIPVAQRELQLTSIENMTFLGWVGEYRNAHSRVRMRCDIDGRVWECSANNLLRGKGCPACKQVHIANLRRVPVTDEEIAGFNVDVVAWPDGGYKNTKQRIRVRCKTHNYEWDTTIGSLRDGRGCHDCAGVPRSTMAQVEAEVNASGCAAFVKWATPFRNAKSRMLLRCSKDGFEWECNINNFRRGRGCPCC